MDENFFKENKAHGNYKFPLGVYEMSIPASHKTLFYLHWHDELEFFHVIEGKALFQMGTSNTEVLAGQAIFVNSREIHAGYILENSDCIFRATVFNIDFISSKNDDLLQSEFIGSLSQKVSPFIHIHGTAPWEMEALQELDKLETDFNLKPYGFQLKIKACLFNILNGMYSNTTYQDHPNHYLFHHRMERIKNILEYIHTHYYLKLGISDLANLMNVSEDHFRRIFKSLLGKTPVEYINYYRVGVAAEMLKNTNDKIIDIALKTGFENISYFIKVFKKNTQLTPKEYRKKYQNYF